VLEAAVVLALVTLALRVSSFTTALRLARWLGASRRSRVALAIERVAWALGAAGRRLPGGTNCLAQALAGQALLRRSGRRAVLRIGVARQASGEFAAHAWVDCGGQIVVGGAERADFTALPPLAGAGS